MGYRFTYFFKLGSQWFLNYVIVSSLYMYVILSFFRLEMATVLFEKSYEMLSQVSTLL